MMRLIRRTHGRRAEEQATDLSRYMATRPAVLAIPVPLREQVLAWGRATKPPQITENDLWRDLPLLAAWVEAKRGRLPSGSYAKTILRATGWLNAKSRFSTVWYDYFLKDLWPTYLEDGGVIEVDSDNGGRCEARPFTGTGLYWIGPKSTTDRLYTLLTEHRNAVGAADVAHAGTAGVESFRPPYVYFKDGAPLWLVDVQPGLKRGETADVGNFTVATSVTWANLSFEPGYNPQTDPVLMATVGPILAAARRKRMASVAW